MRRGGLWDTILSDPQLRGILEEGFETDFLKAREKAKELFWERQDIPSLTLWEILGPLNWFSSPYEANIQIAIHERFGFKAPSLLRSVKTFMNPQASRNFPTASWYMEAFYNAKPPRDLLYTGYHTLHTVSHSLSLLPPPQTVSDFPHFVKVFHKMYIYLYKLALGFDILKEMEVLIKEFERAGGYDDLSIVVYSLLSGDDSYLIRLRNFSYYIGNAVKYVLAEGVLAFLKGGDFNTHGHPVLEQLRDPKRIIYPALKFPIRLANAMIKGDPFFLLSGEPRIIKAWKEIRLVRHYSSLKVLAFFKVGGFLGVGGRKFVLDNAHLIFPKSPNPRKTTYDYLSRLGKMLYIPCNVREAVLHGVLLSNVEEPWAEFLRRTINSVPHSTAKP
ncbi:MAG: hypothetical protein GXO39_06935 [Thermotogae bacterium]|nr:hypothetical protein [Thermotogota bacterium]